MRAILASLTIKGIIPPALMFHAHPVSAKCINSPPATRPIYCNKKSKVQHFFIDFLLMNTYQYTATMLNVIWQLTDIFLFNFKEHQNETED